MSSEEFEESDAVGWDAIDAALAPVYGETEPTHWGSILPWGLGGNDPLQGVSAYRNDSQTPHLHYVTYGMSELYEKESDDPETSGFGFEFTFRLKGDFNEIPIWVVNFLNNLARYVYETGNVFGVGHTTPLNSPIHVGSDTKIRAVTFIQDPQLEPIDTPNGYVEFLQIVGLTDDELVAIEAWNSERFCQLMAKDNPWLITDLDRSSFLEDPAFAEQVRECTLSEGSSTPAMYTPYLRYVDSGTETKIVLGAIMATGLSNHLLGRIPFDRDLTVYSDEFSIQFAPADEFSVNQFGDEVTLNLPKSKAHAFAAMLVPVAGTYSSEEFPNLTLVIEPTEIKDRDGNVTDVIGE